MSGFRADRSEAELLAEYAPIARAVASRTFLPGADRDDVRQEAMIGLLIGLRDFRPGCGCTRRSFLFLVVERHLYDELRRRTRQRSRTLDEAARPRDEWDPVGDAPAAASTEDVVLERERMRELAAAARRLSPIEKLALGGVLDGTPYVDLVAGHGFTNAKQVDNARQRATRKLREALA